jgi:hypothetical protein
VTKRERAQVVELLRCCADVCNIEPGHGLYSVAQMMDLPRWDDPLGRSPFVWDMACKARNHVFVNGAWSGYWHECLEAAARVEEGSYP